MAKKLTQKPNASWAFEIDKINAWAYCDEAFTPKECQKIIDYAEQFEKKLLEYLIKVNLMLK